MPRITVSISDEQDERLEEISGDGRGKPYSSKSAAVRAFLDGDEGTASLGEADELRDELDAVRDERDELADRVEELERENERLHRERRQILEQHDLRQMRLMRRHDVASCKHKAISNN